MVLKKVWLFLVLTLSFAAVSNLRADDWDRRFDELCSYDSGFCKSLKNSNGTWKQPKPEIIAAFKTLADNIHAAGRTYHVDPRAIAGAILAENSLNVTITDDVQDFLVKHKLASKGAVLGKKFSFGWGQLYMDAALEAEPIAAKLEGRAQRSQEEIAQALLRPEDAIKYVGAVLRNIQDVYGESGMDISKNVGVLDTLYNLGKAKEHAATTKAAGGKPKVNYFGFFVEHNLGAIESAIGPGVVAPVVAAQVAPAATTVETPKSNLTKQPVSTKAITLYVAPPHCSANGSGTEGEYNKVASLTNFMAVGTLAIKKPFTVVSPGMGCGLEEWSLIRDEKGLMGWVSNKNLAASSVEELREPSPCRSSVSGACAEQVSETAKAQFLSTVENEGLYLRLLGPKKKINWKNPDFCYNRGSSSGSSSSPTPAVAKPPRPRKKLSTEEAKALFDTVSNYKKVVLEQLNREARAKGMTEIRYWDDYTNPYSSVLSSNFGAVKDLEACSPTSNGKPPALVCNFDMEDFARAMAFTPHLDPSFGEIKGLVQSLSNVSTATPIEMKSGSDDKSIIEARKRWIDLLKPCEEVSTKLPRTKDLVAKLVGNLKKASNIQLSNLDNDRKYIESNIDRCKLILEAFPKDANSVARASNANVNQNESYCDLSIPYSYPSGSGTATTTTWYRIDKKLLKSLFAKVSDRDDFMYNQLFSQFQYNILNSGSSSSSQQTQAEDECSYDPFKTAAYIEGLLKNKCVRNVQVPDPWLMKKLKVYGARVIYRPFLDDDRFLVNLSTVSCEETNK